MPPDELLDDEDDEDDEDVVELDELELLLEEELELDELELLLDDVPQKTPPLPHWSLQVFSPIQLWLFSQPQPLVWLLQIGWTAPYQLQTQASVPPDELDEDELELLLLELLLLELEELELEEVDPFPPPCSTQSRIVPVESLPLP